MSMSEDIRENEKVEENTSVELDDDQDTVEASSDDSKEETRTNVQDKSSEDEELEN